MTNRLALIACSLFVLALTACGGGGGGEGSSSAPPGNGNNAGGNNPSSPPPTTSGTRFAYVAGIAGLNAFSIDSDSGKLTEIARFAGGTTPRSADVDPSDKFLYSGGAEGVYAYSIEPSTGGLSEIAGSPFASSECCMVNVLVHPSGQFVYATSTAAADGGLWAYRVAAAGALVQVEGSPFQLQGEAAFTTRAFRIAIDPAGHFVFAIDCNTNRVFTLRIDPTSGALVQTGVAIAGGARACSVALDPSGTFAFVASSGDADPQSGGVSSFRVDPATGTLTQISTVAAGTYPVGVSVHPTGKFAYAVSFGSDDVNAYRIESNGALTSIGTPVKTGGSPGSINVDPTGRYAYGVAYNTISGYRIDADTGLLTEIDGSPLTFDNGQAESMTFTGIL